MDLTALRHLRSIRLTIAAGLLVGAACGSDTGVTTVDPPSEISLTPASATISVGDSVKITVLLPQTLAASGATYVSGNTAVAITRTNGWVIGVGRGNTIVTVTSIADTRLATAFSISVAP